MSIDEATRRERGNRVVVSIRLPQDALSALDARCEKLGVSRSEYVAEMLAVALPQRKSLSPEQKNTLTQRLRDHGTLPVAVAIGCPPSTLRRALSGRNCNGPVYRKISAYLAVPHRS